MKTYSLVLPGGLLLLAAVAFVGWAASLESFQGIVRVFPHVVLIAGVFLGLRFNLSRLVFAVLVLGLAERVLLQFAAGGEGEKSAIALFHCVAFLLPINLITISLFRERGLLTLRGLSRLGFLSLQVLLVDWLLRPQQSELVALLEKTLVDVRFSTLTSMPQAALLAFAGAFAVLTIRFIYSRSAFESGLVWALGASFLGLNAWGEGEATTIYLATSSLILIISVIETSYSMAYQDELTGLPTRRALDKTLLRLRSEYAVAMVDVDHFKRINDEYGHDVGDQVLRMVASKLADVSGGGKAFRYGGEEFALLFPGKSVEETLPYLGAVKRVVNEYNFALRDPDRPRKKPKTPKADHEPRKKISITVSIGVAARDNSLSKADEIIQAADKALYQAKGMGRNQVRTNIILFR